MAVVKIQFTQGATVGDVGVAIVGSDGTKVVAKDGNAGIGESAFYRWTWIDVPTDSVIPRGLFIEGPVPRIDFIPDAGVYGDYHLMVEKQDASGFRTVDRRVFRVLLPSGRALPAFDAEADALNFGGQPLGWKPDMEAWLLFLDGGGGGGGGGSPAEGTVNTIQKTDGAGAFLAATGITSPSDGDLAATGTISANAIASTTSVNGASVTATGAVAGASVTASATVSGANVTASSAVSGNTVAATTTITGASVAATSWMSVGASAASVGLYRAPSVNAQLIVAGTKTILATGSTDAYIFCDSSFGNTVGGTGYLYPGTRLSFGVATSEYVEIVSNEIRFKKQMFAADMSDPSTPAAGGYWWSSSGVGKWKSSTGLVTIFAPSVRMANTFANRPAAGFQQPNFVATDGQNEWVDDGTAWRPKINGTLGTEVPAVAGFTHVQASGLTNQATFAKVNGVWEYTWTGSGSAGAAGSQSMRLAYKAAPTAGATGYRVTAHFRMLGPALMGGTFSYLLGLGWRLASNGSCEFMEWCISNSAKANPQRRRYTVSGTGNAPTFTFSAQVVSTADEVATKDIWLRIVRLNTGVRKFYISFDGIHFRKMSAQDTTANEFFTPDQILFEICVFGDTNTDAEVVSGALVDSWLEEAF